MREPPGKPLPARREPIRAGETAPLFVLPAVATDGSRFELDLAEWLGVGPVLLVFYEDDGMPICTRELRAFAQEEPLLAAAGIQVVGINTNGLGSHERFQERDRFPFPLVSDFHGEAVKAFGMWDEREKKSRRGVVAIEGDERVTYVLSHFNPGAVNSFAGIFEALGLA